MVTDAEKAGKSVAAQLREVIRICCQSALPTHFPDSTVYPCFPLRP